MTLNSPHFLAVASLVLALFPTERVDAARSCKALSPPGHKTGWKHLSTKLFAAACKANHRGRDKIDNPGGAVPLIGKFAYCALTDKDLKGEWVQTWVQDGDCRWSKLARQKTSEDSPPRVVDGVKDDGGRIFATLPASSAAEGTHRVTMLVEGDYSRADFAVHVWKKGTKAIVTDIDATLTTSDMEMAVSQLANMFGGSYSPKAYKCGNDVIRAYADKGYKIIYLTGRGGFLRTLTTRWISDHGFPRGAYSFMEWFMVPPSSAVQGAYKADTLRDLVAQKGIKLEYGYGNAVHDATAYLTAGIPKDRIYIIGPHAGTQGTVPIAGDYCAHLPVVRALPRVSQP